jgi:hypothetical protein
VHLNNNEAKYLGLRLVERSKTENERKYYVLQRYTSFMNCRVKTILFRGEISVMDGNPKFCDKKCGT